MPSGTHLQHPENASYACRLEPELTIPAGPQAASRAVPQPAGSTWPKPDPLGRAQPAEPAAVPEDRGILQRRKARLLAPKQRKSKLARCRQLVEYLVLKLRKTRQQLVAAMFGEDAAICELCGEGKWRKRERIAAHRSRQNWVIALS